LNGRRLLLSLAALSILILGATTATAQIPSNSLDDVPPGFDAWYIIYTLDAMRFGPNHQLAYVQTGPNEQKVWFSFDVGLQTDPNHPGPGHSYYNRRYRADASSPWYWQYSLSQAITGARGFIDTVLYSPFPRYQDPNGVAWSYIMYTIDQPGPCNGNELGIATVQYSADGVNWNSITPLHHAGGPSLPCAPNLGPNLVAVEAIDAVDDGQGTIHLVGQEGKVSLLVDPNNMDQTFASMGTSTYATSSDVTIDAATCMLTNSGVFSPLMAGASSRFRTYSYFQNMAMAWDAANGDLYCTRGYPYPLDRNPELGATIPSSSVTTQLYRTNPYWGVPQLVEGCAVSPAIYPNRYQIYKMHLGSLSNFAQLHTGTWTLVADRGYSTGYLQDAVSPQAAQLVPGQIHGTRDEGAASFLRDGGGNLVATAGIGTVFGASTLMAQLSGGACYVTGNERVVAEPIVMTCTPPSITVQPSDAAPVYRNGTAYMSVTATGYDLTYQWYYGESGDTSVPVNGAISRTLSVPVASTTKLWARVTGGCGVANSAAAWASVYPTIYQQPASSLTVGYNSTASTTVYASGAYLHYIWRWGDGTPIANAPDSPSLITPSITADSTAYCEVRSGTAGVYSYATSLTVCYADQPNIYSLTTYNNGSCRIEQISASNIYDVQWYQGMRGDVSNMIASGSTTLYVCPTVATQYWCRVIGASPDGHASCYNDSAGFTLP
jgi:hypothetical protein